MEFIKTYKKRIITVISISLLTVIIATGIVGKVVYSRAKANTKYTQDKLTQIALGKVPGEVIEVEKELNFEEAVYEYEFKIKDKESMQQIVRVESKNGVILMAEQVKIDISSEINNKIVRITITDSGIGIPKDEINDIFERFYIVDKSRSKEKGGSGLGLSIAKLIVDIHKGSINVEVKKVLVQR